MNTSDQQDERKLQSFAPWRRKIHEIIFGYTTFGGKLFDILLLVLILLSVLVVMLESVSWFKSRYGNYLNELELIFTILFTIEYIARLISSPRPLKYMVSFMGIIDFISLIPTFLGFFFFDVQSLLVIRSIRLIRVFRILKLTRYLGGAETLGNALWASRFKIIVFLGSVLCIVVIMGTVLYMVEGKENGFTSIPQSIYWAIVTLTTVGYGDIAPGTVTGKTIASIVMILGYAILAVPTGIVTNELISASRTSNSPISTDTLTCPRCKKTDLAPDSNYCRHCGEELDKKIS